jgi:hypothetical protein
LAKQQDHWGKGSSSTSNVDPDADKLRETLIAKDRSQSVVAELSEVRSGGNDISSSLVEMS